jgi:hypothetical protein
MLDIKDDCNLYFKNSLLEKSEFLETLNVMEVIAFAKKNGWMSNGLWRGFFRVIKFDIGNKSDLTLLGKRAVMKKYSLRRQQIDSIEPEVVLQSYIGERPIKMKLYSEAKIKLILQGVDVNSMVVNDYKGWCSYNKKLQEWLNEDDVM